MFSRMTRFESLLQALPDALLGLNQTGVIWFVNGQTELLFGYDHDELVGKPIETLLPEHREEYVADLKTRPSGNLGLTGRHRDGTEFPLNINMSHIETGDVLFVIATVADVTEQMQTVKNAQLVTAIVKYSNDAIVGNTLERIITSWNPAAERMYGHSSEEMIGKPGWFMAPDWPPR
jgi:PAS domain S-box-containing protein